jgi:imidazolonepropionase-like amidohydrolase
VRVAISGGRLIDGTGAAPVQNSVVIVADGRIESVGTTRDFPVPHDAERIDATGYTVLPGFIDCHAHLTAYDYDLETRLRTPASLKAIRTVRNLEMTLAAGVTTVREAGGVDLGIKLAVEEGLVPGPRLFISICILGQTGALWDLPLASGAKLDMRGIYGEVIRYCGGIEELRQQARELIHQGADLLNIHTTSSIHRDPERLPYAMLTPEEISAVVTQANAAGRHVMAHVDGGPGVRNAILAGVRSVDHPYYLADEDIELLLEKGTYLVPTLACNHGIIDIAERNPTAGVHAEAIAGARKIIPIHEDGFRRAARAGVKIAMGTDSFGEFQGDNLMELALMVRGGFSPMQAIVAATSVAAECIGASEELGSVTRGKAADLLLFDGDPLGDIGLLRDKSRLRLIMKAGKVYKNTLLH